MVSKYLTESFFYFRVIYVVIIYPTLVSCIIRRINGYTFYLSQSSVMLACIISILVIKNPKIKISVVTLAGKQPFCNFRSVRFYSAPCQRLLMGRATRLCGWVFLLFELVSINISFNYQVFIK